MSQGVCELLKRASEHDNSKLVTPEKELFDEYSLELRKSTYGDQEYNEFLLKLDSAIKHHYENNSHHPEHYENGINDFDLFDLFEMFFDWKASSERHDDGNIYKSIEINKDRFSMTEQLCQIFKNTAKNLKF
jgi:hypothetical protein